MGPGRIGVPGGGRGRFGNGATVALAQRAAVALDSARRELVRMQAREREAGGGARLGRDGRVDAGQGEGQGQRAIGTLAGIQAGGGGFKGLNRAHAAAASSNLEACFE